MQWSDVPWQPSSRLLRQFAGLCLLFFAILAWLQLHSDRVIIASVLAGLGLIVGVIGLLWPPAVRPIFVGWLVLAFPIGWLIWNGCLALVFFGLLTPLGLVFRLMGRDPLALRRDANQESYLQPKPQTPPGNYYRTF